MSVDQLEPWLTQKEIAAHLGCSERWIKYRVVDGMPSAIIAGRRKFRASESEKWLQREGHMTRSAA